MYWRLSIAAVMMAASTVFLGAGAWADDAAKPADNPAAAPKPEAKEDAAAAPAKTDDAKAAGTKPWYRGSFSTGFDGVFARGGDADLDFNQSLQFQVDPPQCDKLHLRGSFWMQENLDSNKSGSSELRSLNDSFQSDVRAQVQYLYAELDNLWLKSELRIGRQRIMEGAAYNRIDGVYFKQQLKIWDWYAFAGTRASFFGDDFMNPVVGGGASVSPFKTTKIALDAYYGHERRSVESESSFHGPVAALFNALDGHDTKKEVNDLNLSLSVWQTVCQYFTVFGRYNWLMDGGNELTLNGTGYLPLPWNITYEATYRRQFSSIGDRMNDVTSYSRLMGTYETYDDYFLALHRPINKQLTISLEGELRDSHNKNWSNRDYRRIEVLLSGEKLFKPVLLDAKIGLEHWNVSGGEGTWALVGEVGRRWKTVQVALGTDYQRYEDRVTTYNETLKGLDAVRVWFASGILQGYNPLMLFYDHYTVKMHENIYTVYAKTKWSFTKNQDLNAKLTFEEDDSPDSPYWRVQLNYTIRF